MTTTKNINHLHVVVSLRHELSCGAADCGSTLTTSASLMDEKRFVHHADTLGWSALQLPKGVFAFCPEHTEKGCVIGQRPNASREVGPKFPDGHTPSCLCDVCYGIKKEALR